MIRVDDFTEGPRDVEVDLNAPTEALVWFTAQPGVREELARRRAAEESKRFDPREARDQRGRWTRGAVHRAADVIGDINPHGRPDGAGTVDDPIAVGDDLDKAVRLLADGKHVRLDRVDQVGTLVSKLADVVKDAERRKSKAPNYDLCKVSVPGTNLFCQQSAGVSRAQMPQLKGFATEGTPAWERAGQRGDVKVSIEDDLRNALHAIGVSTQRKRVKASWLKASQSELSGTGVASMLDGMRTGKVPERPIFVTRDGYVIDGHHRWAAQVTLDTHDGRLGDVDMDVEVIDLDIGAALDFTTALAAHMGIASRALGERATPTTKGLEYYADLLTKLFDPHEPRDEQGRWTATGAVRVAGAHALVSKALLGGFTYSATSGHVPKRGLAVSPYPDREEQIAAADLSRARLRAYADRNADLLAQPGHYMGAWRDGDHVYLDVTVVADTEEEAQSLSIRYDQQAFYNLATGEVVNVRPGAAAERHDGKAAPGAGPGAADRSATRRDADGPRQRCIECGGVGTAHDFNCSRRRTKPNSTWNVVEGGTAEHFKRDVEHEARIPRGAPGGGRWTTGGAGLASRLGHALANLPIAPRQSQTREGLKDPERANASLLADPTVMANLPEDVQARLVEHVQNVFDVSPQQLHDNLAAVFDRAPESIREQGKAWYRSAGDEASRVAEDTGFARKQVVGAIAATSPQMEWGANLAVAEYLAHAAQEDWVVDADTLRALTEHRKVKKARKGGEKFDESLLDWARIEVAKAQRLNPDVRWPDTLEGTRLSDHPPLVRAALIKAMGQAGLHTGDGRPLGYWDDVRRSRKIVSYSSGLDGMSKALRILGSRGQPGEPPALVLNGHKVRSFYNNILLSEDNPFEDVTMDTHAISAAAGRAIPASSPLISKGFTAPAVAPLGLKGTYPVFADAYRAVAREHGLSPHQAQAIIWLQWREEHP